MAKRIKVERAQELRREMTPEETLLWQHLRANRLQGLHWRRQHVIAGFIADFYCHSARVVVELDGGVHTTQVEYDTERDRILVRHGLLVLRFTNDDVRTNIWDVLAQIRRVSHARQQPRSQNEDALT